MGLSPRCVGSLSLIYVGPWCVWFQVMISAHSWSMRPLFCLDFGLRMLIIVFLIFFPLILMVAVFNRLKELLRFFRSVTFCYWFTSFELLNFLESLRISNIFDYSLINFAGFLILYTFLDIFTDNFRADCIFFCI